VASVDRKSFRTWTETTVAEVTPVTRAIPPSRAADSVLIVAAIVPEV
jgi:hypothetical protein